MSRCKSEHKPLKAEPWLVVHGCKPIGWLLVCQTCGKRIKRWFPLRPAEPAPDWVEKNK